MICDIIATFVVDCIVPLLGRTVADNPSCSYLEQALQHKVSTACVTRLHCESITSRVTTQGGAGLVNYKAHINHVAIGHEVKTM